MAAFSGEPHTIWLTQAGMDCDMSIIEDFWFVDRRGRRWDAPAGAHINGASIPRSLWTLVGSPYTGDYRRASIVHDVACRHAADAAARRAADRMFFEACRAGGCSLWEATVLYVGVRIGAWWGQVASVVATEQVRLAPQASDVQQVEDFQQVSQMVLQQGETDDPDAVEARVDTALKLVAARRAALNALAMSSTL